MIKYPIPLELTHQQFYGLVTDFYCRLKKYGLDPSLNMVAVDRDEALNDGTTRTHFTILVSEDAALILVLSVIS
jgi:hypothetical protein